jgi:membrane-associated phospholipid phosphatase
MKKHLAFYIPYILFMVILGCLLSVYPKAELHLLLNSVHTPFFDYFFRIITEVGGLVPYFIIVALLFYRYKEALSVFIAFIGSGLLVQVMKNVWNSPRPKAYFAEFFPDVVLPLVQGVHVHTLHSFPSGHTTAAFAVFLTLASYSKNSFVHFGCFLLAALVGYSRIYLSQHFAFDVFVGSAIGIGFAIFSKYLIDNQPINWVNGSLRDIFIRKKSLGFE